MIFIFAWYTLPIFAYIWARCYRQRTLHLPTIVLTMMSGYLLIIATVVAADVTDRMTTAAGGSIPDQGSDTGRAVAPIIGMPLTAVWYTLLFGVLYGGDWVFRKLFVRELQGSQITSPSQESR